MVEKIAKEKFNEVKEFTYEKNHDDLTYYFTGYTGRKRFDDLNNGIDLLEKYILVK